MHAIAAGMLWQNWPGIAPEVRAPPVLRANIRTVAPVSARIESDTTTSRKTPAPVSSPPVSLQRRHSQPSHSPAATAARHNQDATPFPTPASVGQAPVALSEPAAAEHPGTSTVAVLPDTTPAPRIAARAPVHTAAGGHAEGHTDVAYLHSPKPDYPPAARRRGQEGTVVIRTLVNTEGVPGQARIIGPSGIDDLDQSALLAVQRWRFAPARAGSKAIEHWVDIPVTFRLAAN